VQDWYSISGIRNNPPMEALKGEVLETFFDFGVDQWGFRLIDIGDCFRTSLTKRNFTETGYPRWGIWTLVNNWRLWLSGTKCYASPSSQQSAQP
jgi:hypothetical protein